MTEKNIAVDTKREWKMRNRNELEKNAFVLGRKKTGRKEIVQDTKRKKTRKKRLRNKVRE